MDPGQVCDEMGTGQGAVPLEKLRSRAEELRRMLYTEDESDAVLVEELNGYDEETETRTCDGEGDDEVCRSLNQTGLMESMFDEAVERIRRLHGMALGSEVLVVWSEAGKAKAKRRRAEVMMLGLAQWNATHSVCAL